MQIDFAARKHFLVINSSETKNKISLQLREPRLTCIEKQISSADVWCARLIATLHAKTRSPSPLLSQANNCLRMHPTRLKLSAKSKKSTTLDTKIHSSS